VGSALQDLAAAELVLDGGADLEAG
jgi:hypothetical protein